jgi:DNA polymerase III alpha subunit
MIPLFSSANSFNSILTIDKKSKEGGSDSIFDICVENNLKECFLIEKNPSSFPQALKNATEKGIQLIYGLEFIVCADSDNKELDSIETEHKIFVLAKSGKGYKESLMKMYSDAATRGNFKGLPRTDFKYIDKFWSDELVMMIPFYGNFLERNLFSFSNCLVNFKKYNPVFCLEYHELPLDKFMRQKLEKYAGDNGFETLETKRVYYKDEGDFLSYLTYAVIQNKSSIECPNLDGMCSKKFAFNS